MIADERDAAGRRSRAIHRDIETADVDETIFAISVAGHVLAPHQDDVQDHERVAERSQVRESQRARNDVVVWSTTRKSGRTKIQLCCAPVK